MERAIPKRLRAPGNLPAMSKHRTSFCTALNVEDGKAPEWVELIPAADADGMVKGRDGRKWLWDAQAQNSVLTAFQQRGIDLVFDWEHATQRRAPNGEEAPASAWGKQLEIRDGALWGKSEWTPRAENQVVNKEYRFLSPVFDYDPQTLRIARMVTVGLLNTPNLHLTALNQEEIEMKRSTALAAAIVTALGLNAETDDDAVAQAINSLKKDKDTATALNAEQKPNLERYVPRGDYDALVQRATNAEQQLKAHGEATHKAAVDMAIDGALKAGKITPATEDYHRAACSDAEGLERFKKFVGAAAAVADPTNLDGKKPDNQATALNAEEREACRLLGMSEADFIAAKKENK